MVACGGSSVVIGIAGSGRNTATSDYKKGPKKTFVSFTCNDTSIHI